MNYFEKLKVKWEISSNWQLAVILIVFSITGSLSLKIASPILTFVGVTKKLNPFVFWPLRILVIFPTYQVLLLAVGTLFGQFRFFWNFEKKMLSRFSRKNKRIEQ